MKIVVGNQKTYLRKEEVNDFIDYYKNKDYSNVIIIPSFIFIDNFVNTNFILGSQDVSLLNDISTGEITAKQLKSLNVEYCLVGHSERKSKFFEKKDIFVRKINNLFDSGIIPVLCIGEVYKETDNYKQILSKQIKDIFDDIDNSKEILIAYEPVWAVGTGLIPSSNELTSAINYIKEYISKEYNKKVKVLYGGSVSKYNIDELNMIDTIDGYLIGKVSSIKEEFEEIIEKCQ